MLYLARIIKFRSTKSEIETSSNDQIDKIPNKLLSDSVIAVAAEMSWGGVRAFGLHIQSLPVDLDLLSVQRSIEARGALLDRRDNPDQPISR
jgi:hypothetical protein